MAEIKRTKAEREKDYVKEIELYLKGKYQHEIAEIIGVTQQQIAYDLKVIQKRWIKESKASIEQYRLRELGKIDQIEREAWEAWNESKEEFNAKITKVSKVTKDAKTGNIIPSTVDNTNKTEDRNGNPKYLEVIMKCIERRCKMLGIDAPEKHEHTGKDGGPIKTETNPKNSFS